MLLEFSCCSLGEQPLNSGRLQAPTLTLTRSQLLLLPAAVPSRGLQPDRMKGEKTPSGWRRGEERRGEERGGGRNGVSVCESEVRICHDAGERREKTTGDGERE